MKSKSAVRLPLLGITMGVITSYSIHYTKLYEWLEAITGITQHEGEHIPDDQALVYSGQRWRGQGPAGACERQRTLFDMRRNNFV